MLNAYVGFLGALEKVDTKIVIHLEPESLKCVARNDGELGLQAFCVLKSVTLLNKRCCRGSSQSSIMAGVTFR